MKKYLLLALISLLSPLVASAITPKPGHYDGTIGDGPRPWHAHFVLLKNGMVYQMTLNGTKVMNFWDKTEDEQEFKEHQTIRFSVYDVPKYLNSFRGHLKWRSDTACAGDYREFSYKNNPHSHINDYHIFRFHWVRD